MAAPNRAWQKNIAALSLTSTEGLPQLSANTQTKVMEFLTGKKTKTAINTPRKLMERAKFTHNIKVAHSGLLSEFIQGELMMGIRTAQEQAQRYASEAIAAERDGDYRYAEDVEQLADEAREEARSYQDSLDTYQSTGRLSDADVRWAYALVNTIDETYDPYYQSVRDRWLTTLREMYPDVLGPAPAGGRRKTRKARKTQKNKKSKKSNKKN